MKRPRVGEIWYFCGPESRGEWEIIEIDEDEDSVHIRELETGDDSRHYLLWHFEQDDEDGSWTYRRRVDEVSGPSVGEIWVYDIAYTAGPERYRIEHISEEGNFKFVRLTRLMKDGSEHEGAQRYSYENFKHDYWRREEGPTEPEDRLVIEI